MIVSSEKNLKMNGKLYVFLTNPARNLCQQKK